MLNIDYIKSLNAQKLSTKLQCPYGMSHRGDCGWTGDCDKCVENWLNDHCDKYSFTYADDLGSENFNPVEAIRSITNHIKTHNMLDYGNPHIKLVMSLNLARNVIDKYLVGAEPIKVIHDNPDNPYETYRCPICTDADETLYFNQSHCDVCGAKLNWENHIKEMKSRIDKLSEED